MSEADEELSAPELVRARGLRRVAAGLAAYACAGGLVSFSGWPLNWPRLTDWSGNGVSIQPNAALAALLSGTAILLLVSKCTRAAAFLGAVVAGIGASVLFQCLVGIELGIDDILLFGREWGQRGVLVPGRMGLPGAVSWTILGTALLLASTRTRARAAVPGLACLAAGISFLSIVGYLYRADELFLLPRLTIIALQSSTFILAVALALLLSLPEFPPVRRIIEESEAGIILSRAVPLVIIASIACGFLAIVGLQAGLYDPRFQAALRTFSEVAFFLAVLWWTARAVERQARRTREQARLLELTSDAVFVRGPGDRIETWNHGAQELYGWTQEEALGRSSHALLRTESTEPLESIEAALRREGRWDGELVHTTRDGRKVIVSSRWVLDRRPAGPDAVLEAGNDITIHKAYEEERQRLLDNERRAHHESERANRIKDEFLATLSHELRTPIHVILGWARLLDRDDPDPSLVREAVAVISRNARTQAELVADLLDMNRILRGNVKLEPVLVRTSDLVVEAVEAIGPLAAEKGVEVRSDAGTVGTVRGDALRLRQVLGNLLSNAIKFTPPGGLVRVQVEQAEGHAEIAVADSGIGIPHEFLTEVFEPFRQGDTSSTREYGGLGLGLAIVRQLVRAHGGSVRVESDGIGRGATFTIRLPLAIEEAPSARPDSESPAGVDAAPARTDSALVGATVLVIDDQEDARRFLALHLQRCGASVVTAASATEGLRLLDSVTPDIVLCDIAMPGQDGYAFIGEVRRRNMAIPALALSAYARVEDRDRALRVGYQGHIAKPIDPAELISVVTRTMRETPIDEATAKDGLLPAI